MKVCLSPFVLVASLVSSSQGFAQEAGEPIVIGERFQVESEILGETRAVIVGRPHSYGTGEEEYPILFVLDVGTHFQHTLATASFLTANNRMPEVLVVAVPNGTDRTRDLSPPTQDENEARDLPTHGGADSFLRFLNDELMPWVENRYRTRPYSILVGHSLGGLFAVHHTKIAGAFGNYQFPCARVAHP